MPKLILMRHAKSGWGDPTLPDHDRPLNARGVISASALGDWLRAQGHLPDQALVSSALRTQQTFAGLALDLEPERHARLYGAGTSVLLSSLRAARGKAVLLIAHNPGIGEFAERILSKMPGHQRFLDYPTGATLVAEVPDWPDLDFGQARVLDFVTPHDLKT